MAKTSQSPGTTTERIEARLRDLATESVLLRGLLRLQEREAQERQAEGQARGRADKRAG
jgi:hypothetical protein